MRRILTLLTILLMAAPVLLRAQDDVEARITLEKEVLRSGESVGAHWESEGWRYIAVIRVNSLGQAAVLDMKEIDPDNFQKTEGTATFPPTIREREGRVFILASDKPFNQNKSWQGSLASSFDFGEGQIESLFISKTAGYYLRGVRYSIEGLMVNRRYGNYNSDRSGRYGLDCGIPRYSDPEYMIEYNQCKLEALQYRRARARRLNRDKPKPTNPATTGPMTPKAMPRLPKKVVPDPMIEPPKKKDNF